MIRKQSSIAAVIILLGLILSPVAHADSKQVGRVVEHEVSTGQQGNRRHDLPRLAVTALGNIELFPGLLQWVTAVAGKPFNGKKCRSLETSEKNFYGKKIEN